MEIKEINDVEDLLPFLEEMKRRKENTLKLAYRDEGSEFEKGYNSGSCSAVGDLISLIRKIKEFRKKASEQKRK